MNWEKERSIIVNKIVHQDFHFDELAMELFHFQAKLNNVYREYLEHLHIVPTKIKNVNEIPFLPISFFKSHLVITGEYTPKKVFLSSGTSESVRSKHLIRDPDLYHLVSACCFQHAFGLLISDAVHIGLLPSYASNPQSSLLFMLDYFIKKGSGGYFHYDPMALIDYINEHQGKKIFLWGVSVALINWKTDFPVINDVEIIETGGMKGMQAEITRDELHACIKRIFHKSAIASEYGMTELISQAYALKDGLFKFAPTLQAYPRNISDPLAADRLNTSAALNIIDLANIDSCCFIATDDIGKVYPNRTFEVLGRLDNSDIRGCNLMLSSI